MLRNPELAIGRHAQLANQTKCKLITVEKVANFEDQFQKAIDYHCNCVARELACLQEHAVPNDMNIDERTQLTKRATVWLSPSLNAQPLMSCVTTSVEGKKSAPGLGLTSTRRRSKAISTADSALINELFFS